MEQATEALVQEQVEASLNAYVPRLEAVREALKAGDVAGGLATAQRLHEETEGGCPVCEELVAGLVGVVTKAATCTVDRGGPAGCRAEIEEAVNEAKRLKEIFGPQVKKEVVGG